MDRAFAVRTAERLLDIVEAKTTTLASAPLEISHREFTDPERHEREWRHLFREHPQAVALSSDLPSSGTHATREVAGVPVLLVRGGDGQLRAFRNACRHRGARIAEGSGSGARFVCPWHCWTYDDQGRLVGLPDRASFDPLELEQRGLAALPASEAHGIIYVRPTPGPAFDANELLAGLGPELDAYGIRELRHFQSREDVVPANWKLVADTGIEVYHVEYLHKDTVGPSNIGNTHIFDTWGRNQRMGLASPSILALREQPPEEWDDPFQHFQLVHNLFPASAIVVSAPFVAFARGEPGAHPGESRFFFSVYTWGEIESEQTANIAKLGFAGLFHVLESEDWRVAAQAQRSFELDPGGHTIVGRNEIGVQQLHRACQSALDEAKD